MKRRAEIITCGCRDDDVSVLRLASGTEGPDLRTIENPMKLAQHALHRCPLGIVLGVGEGTRSHLDIIPLLRSVRDMPIIVIAEEDSLDLERQTRQKGIFYYLVHPIGRKEAEAVLRALCRRAGRSGS